MKCRVVIVVCLIWLQIGIIHQPKSVVLAGNIYYVATTGSDAIGRGSFTNPWATPQHAANEMVAGDICYIEAGNYTNGTIIPKISGTVDNYITFENYNGGIVNFIPASQYNGICLIGVSYFQFIGLHIICSGAGSAGAWCENGCTNIIFQNCSFTGDGVGGIVFTGAISNSQISIIDCTLNENCSTAANAQLTLQNCDTFTIQNCTISNVLAVDRCGIDCIESSNGTICNNTVFNTTSMGIYIDAHGTVISNISIYDNLVYNCSQGGIDLSSEKTGGSLSGINIYNNILYGNNRGFRIDQYGNGTTTGSMFNFTFINNTLYSNGINTEIYLSNTPVFFSGCIIRNNLLMNTLSTSDDAIEFVFGGIEQSGTTTEMAIDNNLEYNSHGIWGLDNITGTSGISANPELISPPTNFALQSTSPAIDTGSAVEAPSTDYIGTTRPQGEGYDIGAYEYMAGTTFPAVITIAASSVTSNGAILNGSLTTLGSNSPVIVSFDWGIDTSYASGNVAANPFSITSVPNVFNASLSGLTAGTTYHYRAKAVGAITVYGNDQQFTTSASLSALSVTTRALPNGIVGIAYSQPLLATGGMAPYNWTIIAGALPGGLSLSSNGLVSGTPKTGTGPIFATFKVIDSTNLMATNCISISVVYGTLVNPIRVRFWEVHFVQIESPQPAFFASLCILPYPEVTKIYLSFIARWWVITSDRNPWFVPYMGQETAQIPIKTRF